MARKPATHAKLEKESSSIKGNHGGKREGAGRKKGVPNKVTVELGEAAREYTADCLEILVEIAHNGQSENARLQAVSQLLDRGHGRPKANVEINPEGAAAFSLTVSATRERLQERLARIASTANGTGMLETNGVAIEIEANQP